MSITTPWPTSRAFAPAAFELRVGWNTRAFNNPYNAGSQVIDLQGERWIGRIDLAPTTDATLIAAREALFDDARGQVNTWSIWHFGLPAALGTIAATATAAWTDGSGGAVTWTSGAAVTWVDGAPVTTAAVAAGAASATLRVRPGATVGAGSMLGLGGMQTVRVARDAVADASGLLTIAFAPRARADIPAYSAVATTKPPIVVRMRSADTVPTPWRVGYADGCSFEFIEDPAS